MRGPSQFQQFTTLSPSFTGETVREESPTFPLRDSLAGHRLPEGPLWPLTGSPQVVQQDWRRFTDEEAGVDATGAVAVRTDITGAREMADTTVAVASAETAGTVVEVGAAEADAGEVEGTAETEAGDVAAETEAAGEITWTWAEHEVGVEEAGVTACLAAW